MLEVKGYKESCNNSVDAPIRIGRYRRFGVIIVMEFGLLLQGQVWGSVAGCM